MTGPVAAAPCEQFGVARKRIDHARPMRVEELLDTEHAFLVGEPIGRLEPDLEMAIAGIIARKRLDLHEQRGNQIEGQPDGGELLQERHHAPVVLGGVQTDPRQNMLTCDQVLIKGLMHVPEEGDARHN